MQGKEFYVDPSQGGDAPAQNAHSYLLQQKQENGFGFPLLLSEPEVEVKYIGPVPDVKIADGAYVSLSFDHAQGRQYFQINQGDDGSYTATSVEREKAVKAWEAGADFTNLDVSGNDFLTVGHDGEQFKLHYNPESQAVEVANVRDFITPDFAQNPVYVAAFLVDMPSGEREAYYLTHDNDGEGFEALPAAEFSQRYPEFNVTPMWFTSPEVAGLENLGAVNGMWDAGENLTPAELVQLQESGVEVFGLGDDGLFEAAPIVMDTIVAPELSVEPETPSLDMVQGEDIGGVLQFARFSPTMPEAPDVPQSQNPDVRMISYLREELGVTYVPVFDPALAEQLALPSSGRDLELAAKEVAIAISQGLVDAKHLPEVIAYFEQFDDAFETQMEEAVEEGWIRSKDAEGVGRYSDVLEDIAANGRYDKASLSLVDSALLFVGEKMRMGEMYAEQLAQQRGNGVEEVVKNSPVEVEPDNNADAENATIAEENRDAFDGVRYEEGMDIRTYLNDNFGISIPENPTKTIEEETVLQYAVEDLRRYIAFGEIDPKAEEAILSEMAKLDAPYGDNAFGAHITDLFENGFGRGNEVVNGGYEAFASIKAERFNDIYEQEAAPPQIGAQPLPVQSYD